MKQKLCIVVLIQLLTVKDSTYIGWRALEADFVWYFIIL